MNSPPRRVAPGVARSDAGLVVAVGASPDEAWQPSCWLAQFTTSRCDGGLIRAHLLPRQLIRREFPVERAREIIDDPRSWVPACGGPMGNAGHHGAFDQSRTLRVPRDALPEDFVALVAELNLEWWVDREYGRG